MSADPQEKITPPKEKDDSILKVFRYVAGGESWILPNSDCATDRSKFSLLGIIILLIAFQAFAVSTYTAYIVTDNFIVAIIFGFFFSIFILCIDMVIVRGMRTQYKELTWRVVGLFLIRIAISSILSFIISKPVELLAFKGKIEVRQQEFRSNERTARIERGQNESVRLREVQAEIARVRRETEDRQTEYNLIAQQLIAEIQGRIGSGKVGDGPSAGEIRKQLAVLDENLKQLRQRNNNIITSLEQDERELILQRDANIRNNDINDATADDIADRLIVMRQIEADDRTHTIWWAGFIIVLFFWIIDMSAVLIKIIVGGGTHDTIVTSFENHKQKKYEKTNIWDTSVETQ